MSDHVVDGLLIIVIAHFLDDHMLLRRSLCNDEAPPARQVYGPPSLFVPLQAMQFHGPDFACRPKIRDCMELRDASDVLAADILPPLPYGPIGLFEVPLQSSGSERHIHDSHNG